jgi:hypothetical protein
MEAEIGGKRLQLLLCGPFVENLRLAATRTGRRLEPILASDPDEFERAFAAMTKADAQAVIIQPLFDPYRAFASILWRWVRAYRRCTALGSTSKREA